MSLRKFMHPRNKYKVEPNFKELAGIYPEFRQHLITDLSGKLKFNFKNSESLRVLAEVLLKHDFNLNVKIPKAKLVPALPLRLNYILWIEDLLNSLKIKEIHGLDIGTGAIAIYPLLCSKLYEWRMTGTEIDPSSTSSAIETICENNLDKLIKIFIAKEDTIFKDALVECEDGRFTFSMCNPPFFDTNNVMDEYNSKKIKRIAPRNGPTGSKTELEIEGGEISFIMKMIEESLELKEKIKIYTTMIGHKRSLSFFKKELSQRNLENFTWTEFCQGHTKRWGLAWTFLSKDEIDLKKVPIIRTRTEAAKKRGGKGEDTFALEVELPVDEFNDGVPQVVGNIKKWMEELQIEMTEEERFEDIWTCQLHCYKDSWSHARRKRRLALRLEEQESKKIPPEQSSCSSFSARDTMILVHQESSSNHELLVKSGNGLQFLEFTLAVSSGEIYESSGDSKSKKIKISLILIGGTGGKNALETFRQFLINKLRIRDYFQTQNSKSNSPKKKRKKKKHCTDDNV